MYVSSRLSHADFCGLLKILTVVAPLFPYLRKLVVFSEELIITLLAAAAPHVIECCGTTQKLRQISNLGVAAFLLAALHGRLLTGCNNRAAMCCNLLL